MSQCVPGAKILDLCQHGTTIIQTEAAKLYTKKVNGQTIDRGVAFPVCVSVNEVVCNHSPLVSEERVSEYERTMCDELIQKETGSVACVWCWFEVFCMYVLAVLGCVRCNQCFDYPVVSIDPSDPRSPVVFLPWVQTMADHEP